MDSFTKLNFHVILETRSPGMPNPNLVKGVLGACLEKQGGTVLAYSIRPDHVHLLVSFRPRISLSDSVQRIKTQSSKWLKQRVDAWSGWCPGYLAVTVGEWDVPRFKEFLLRQETFHATRSLADERNSIIQAYSDKNSGCPFPDRTFTWLCVHLIFGTKHRSPLIQGPVEQPLFLKLREIAARNRAEVLEINGSRDHVHLVLVFHQSVCLSDLVRSLKCESGPWIRRQFPDEFLAWQLGFGAFSVSRSGLDEVRRYVRSQKDHHDWG